MYDLLMQTKRRLSASVDADLLDAAEAMVARGSAASVSAWVNEALRLKADHDRRLHALGEFIRTYEAEHGEITAEEMDRAERALSARATVVRGRKRRNSA